MRIAHVLTRLTRGGAEENTIATALWQAARGHDVVVLHGGPAAAHWQNVTRQRVPLTQVPELVPQIAPLQDWQALFALRRALAAFAPDVVHTHQSKAGVLGRRAALGLSPRPRIVHGIHIVPFEAVSGSRAFLYKAAERWVSHQTDCFVGVTPSVCDAYVRAGLADAARVRVVPSGIDLARFSAPARARKQEGPLAVVMLAALEPRKGHARLFDALSRAGMTARHMQLICAGQGPLLAPLQQQIAQLGLRGVVRLVGHRDDPERLLAEADVSLLCSAREGLPRVVVQSLASGCPVATTPLPGLAGLLEPGRNGVIAPDIDSLVNSLSQLANDRAWLAHLSQGAERSDVSPWSLDNLGRLTTQAYGIAS